MRPPAPPPPFLRRRGEPRGVEMGAGFAEMCRHNVNQILSRISPATCYLPVAHVDQALSLIADTAYVPGAPAPISRIPSAAAGPYVPAAATPVALYVPAAAPTPVDPYVPAAAASTPVAPYVPAAPHASAAANPVAPYVPAAAAPHASAAAPLPNPRRGRRNRQRKRRRDYLAEQAAASRDPSLTPAPAPGTRDLHAATWCPASSSAASLVDPLLHVPAATHATATRPTPLYRIPAVPSASDASPFPISRVPAAEPHTTVTSSVPRASSSPAAPHFSPPRELSKRATPTGSAFSAPRKFSRRPAEEESDCQIAGAVDPPALTGPTPPSRPSPACPPRPMPPPPSPLSHTPAAAPRASASPAVDQCSPPGELSQHAAASGCGYSPRRELSQSPAAVAIEESEIVGAVGPAGADPVRNVPHASATPLPGIPDVPHATASQAVHYSPQGSSPSAPRPVDAASPPGELSQHPEPVATDESNCQNVGAVGPAGADRVTNAPPRDVRMAREAQVKSVPEERDATVGREEESKSTEELKRELERVSKEMNDLKNEFAELKKSMKNKDLEIEAKEAEIQKFKKAKVGCSSKDISSTRMDIDHTPANEALLAEASCWTSTRRAEKLCGKNKELYPSRDEVWVW